MTRRRSHKWAVRLRTTYSDLGFPVRVAMYIHSGWGYLDVPHDDVRIHNSDSPAGHYRDSLRNAKAEEIAPCDARGRPACG